MDKSELQTLTRLKEVYSAQDVGAVLETVIRLLPQTLFKYTSNPPALQVYNENNLILLLGYDAAAVKGWNNNLLQPVHPDDQTYALEQNQAIEQLKEGEQLHYSCRFIHNSGEIKPITIKAGIMNQGNEGSATTILYTLEYNPEKQAQTNQDKITPQESKQSLEEKINELHHRNSELEGFAYIASHDLQEPLRKLTAFSERLQTKFKEQLGEEGQLYLDRIVASTENMRLLIDSLLEFSRTARSNRHFSLYSLSDLLKETQSDLELKIEESGSLIQAGPLPAIEVIPSQIKQLFSNLLGNSIKFKKADQPPSITITCESLANPEKKNLHLQTGKEYFKLVVTDNGIGFEKEYAEKIFQLFQRLHGRHEYPGSGIGLAICKKIVENHSGHIYADAEPDKGAVFTIILPENQL